MKDLEIRGVPHGLLTDGWWLESKPEDPPVTPPSRPPGLVADLALAGAVTLALCLLSSSATDAGRDHPASLAFSSTGDPR